MTYTMGVDIGSITSKCAILKNGQEIVAHAVIKAGTGSDGPERAVSKTLNEAGLNREDLTYVVATGYGRVIYADADEEISEIACHAKGAAFQVENARTVIDIGGQDAKAIKLAANGKVLKFEMNEKCAAGTGRFLDVMAQALGYPVAELGILGKRSTEKVIISSTCTVFAESEVISHLTAKKKVEDVVAGIHDSIARRIAGLVRRVGIEETVVMTGGVAQNKGVVNALEEKLECKLTVPPYTQINGALGAAIIAFEKNSRRLK
ncbi:acyl-CoA dehydratase activase [Metallumcola ferriviriculae]|uniref:Acyl-CoA dehydratase activase n=1 Tax=Metallumcola ferriviriculae TaxID=3039180 RepID=A0AAU0UP62_9FIRM|nr:acyl-CoA dehydratase activase [Desulfitibacteraceae bacterium MK1]